MQTKTTCFFVLFCFSVWHYTDTHVFSSLLFCHWDENHQKLPVRHTCHLVSLFLCLVSETNCKNLGPFQNAVKISKVANGGEILTQNQQKVSELLREQFNFDSLRDLECKKIMRSFYGSKHHLLYLRRYCTFKVFPRLSWPANICG